MQSGLQPVLLSALGALVALGVCGTASAQSLTSVTLGATTVAAGTPVMGTVGLSAAAPSGGATVSLSSDKTNVATVPSSVSVPQGQTTTTFTVTPLSVTSSQTATITASKSGVTKTAALTVLPLLASLSVSRSNVLAGTGLTGTIVLNGPAPAGGSTATLTSSSTTTATVPSTVTVPAGTAVVTFPITPLAAGTTTLTASLAGVKLTRVVTVTATPVVLGVTLGQTSVASAGTVSGTVTLNGSAPVGGATIVLSSSNATAATVPASVVIAAGQTTATFTATAKTVTSITTSNLTATHGASQSATLTVTPSTVIYGLTLVSPTAASGTTVTGTVTLNGPAPAGGFTVTLSSSNAGVATVPASAAIAQGQTSATFPVTAKTVASLSTVSINAVLSGTTKTAQLSVTPSPTVAAVSFSPSPVASGGTSTATVTLNGPAPAGGTVVNLQSSNTQVATVPSSVTVATGTTSKTFSVTALNVPANADVAVVATYGGTSANGVLTVAAGVPTSLSLGASTAVGGTAITATLTLSGKAPTGGTVVRLVSSNPSAASVPATVTVAAGQTTKTFTVTTLGVNASASSTIIATYAGVGAVATINVTRTTLASVKLASSNAAAGGTVNGTVALTGAAPGPGGAVVSLGSSKAGAATMPSTVAIPTGESTAKFTVSGLGVDAAASLSVTASYAGASLSTPLTVSPAGLATLALAPPGPTGLAGGTNTSGTVTLTGPAGPSSALVTLSSSRTAVSVPASVTIPSGAKTTNFTIKTQGVAAPTTATITATHRGTSLTAQATLAPASISTLTLNPTTVAGGVASVGTVTLSGPAGTGGSVVTLASNNTNATVPASVTVPSGATTATFSISTKAVTAQVSATITATLGVAKTASLTITPPAVSAVSLSLSTVTGGTNPTGTVTLSGPAPTGGTTVNLASSKTTAATVPTSVLVAAGAKTATATVTTLAVTAPAAVTITATLSGASQTAPLTVNPAAPKTLTLNPTAVIGKTSSTATLTLTGPAPTGGLTVNLTSSNTTAATVPTSVSVAQGTTTKTFTVTTLAVATQQTAVITATANATPQTATLTVNPPDLASLALSPTTVGAGATSTGTVTLTGAAPTGGTTVTLSSSNTNVATVPASVLVAAGQTTKTFTATSKGVAANTNVTITAALGATTKPATLTVTPAVLSSLTLSPTSVPGGTNVTGTVTLSGPAGPSGVSVAMTAAPTTAATVPGTITVAAGQTTQTVTVTTLPQTASATVTVTATLSGTSKPATLTVTPPKAATVTLSPTTVNSGVNSTGTVTLNGPAPSANVTVTLTSSVTTAATVPTSVTVTSGQTTATFTVTSLPVPSSTNVTITASAGGGSPTAPLTVAPAVPAQVTLNPTSVTGGQTSTGTVTLTGNATGTGIVVSLTSSITSVATVPTSVTVASGTSTKTFTVTTVSTGTPQTPIISAIAGGVTKSATLSVAANVGTVTGNVKDQATSAGISGATVKLHGNGAITATTNASGAYTLNNVPLGTQSVDVTATGYVSATSATFTVGSGTTAAPDVLLQKAVGSITGTIQDAQTSNGPLSGATVKVNGSSPLISTTTAANGTYTLASVPAGTVTVNAAMTGYVAKNSGNLTVTNGTTTPAGALVLTRTTVNVSGSVKDSATNAALAGVNVSVQEQAGLSATTDASGNYTLTGVFWGSVHVVASAQNYQTQTVAGALTAGTNATQNFLLTSNLGTIAGTVSDAMTGFGLWANVALADNPGIQVDTDIYGAYSLANVPVGSHQLVVVSDRYDALTSAALSVTGGTTTTANHSLNPTRVSISGGVYSPENGNNPVSGVTVTAVRSGVSATTDASGAYQLSGLTPGAEYVVFQKAGYRPQAAGEIDLWPRNDVGGYNVQLFLSQAGDPAATVHGTVTDSTGAPVAGASVGSAGATPVLTAADGTYSTTAPMGSYVLTASKSGYRTAYAGAHPFEGDVPTPWQIQQDFVLPSATATGTVTLTTFDPVAGVPANSDVWLGGAATAYRILVPASGTRSIAMPAGPVYGWFVPRTVPAGGTLSLAFNGASSPVPTAPHWALSGTVYRQIMGTPIAGATVSLTNSAASFTTTVTTDANGRWRFASGPVGAYTILVSAPGLITSDPWGPTVADDNGLQIGDFALRAASDDGSISIDSPTEGTTLTTALTSVSCTATLPRPGDYIVSAQVSLSSGSLAGTVPSYSIDGRHFQLSLTASLLNGPLTLTIRAFTHDGALIVATRNLTVQLPIVPATVTLNPASVSGGNTSTGTVTLSQPAATGGTTVSLSSGSPLVAVVQPTVTVPEGQLSADFTVTALPTSTGGTAVIGALAAGVTQSATLTVTPSTYGTITGTLLDAQTGFGIPGQLVWLTDDPGIQTYTDIFGGFTLANIAVGAHSLTSTPDRYATVTSASLDVTAAGTATTQISAAPNPATISGSVADASNSTIPVGGVTVTAVRSGQTTTTAADGTFTLSNVPPGIEYLVFQKSGYSPTAMGEFFLPPGGGVNAAPWIRPVDPADPTGVATGTVRDALGSPLAGVTVTPAGQSSVTTAADGTYTATVPLGAYVLSFQKAGYRTIFSRVHPGPQGLSTGFSISQDAVLPLANATGTVNLTTLDPTLRVPGAGDITFFGFGGTYRIMTTATGTRSFTVPAGPLTIGLYSYLTTIPSGGTVSLVAGGAGSAPSTSPSWAVLGPVFKQSTGAPIPGATITLTNGAFTTSVTTDGNGQYVFAGGPLGDYAVGITAPGYTPTSWNFTAQDGGNLYWGAFGLTAPADAGTLSIDSPLANATLTQDLSTVTLSAALPTPGDYIDQATVSISNGTVQTIAPTYGLDGQHATLAIASTSQNGPETVTATAITRYGATLTATRDVTFQIPVVPAAVTLNPSSVPGGGGSTGTVTLNQLAQTGGAVVSLSSSNPAAIVPASATVPEGQIAADFPITTASTASPINATISATFNGTTQTATLAITTSTTGTFAGTVTDATTGFGLWANVALADNPGIQVNTDIYGAYTLSNVPVGSHQLVVNSDRYDTLTSAALSVTGGTTTTANLPLNPTPSTISGTIRSPENGLSSIAGATVIAVRSGQSTTSDASGAYQLTGLAPGVEYLVVRKAGYRPQATGEISLAASNVTNYDPWIYLSQTGDPSVTIQGSVKDASGAPVAGVSVGPAGATPVLTAADGTYSMTAPMGSYVITAAKSGFRTLYTPVQNFTGDFLAPWQIQHDFVLPDATATGTVALATFDPVAKVPASGDLWLFGASSLYRIYVPASGTRSVTMPAGQVFGWFEPKTLPSAGSLTLAFNGVGSAIPTSPHWILAGTVYHQIMGTPIAGATVTLSNSAASFTTSVTTDANGRWSFTSGPVGTYTVTVSAPGLITSDPWGPTVADDNGYQEGDFPLHAASDNGTISIDSPTEGATLLTALTNVSCTAVLPRPNDYIVSVQVSLSSGSLTSSTPVYDLDGRHVRLDVVTAIPNGAVTIGVRAFTHYGALLTATRNVTLQQSAGLTGLSLSPTTVTAATGSTGTVTFTTAAPSGGALISLSSNNAAAAVPASVTIPQGATSANFAVTTTSVTSATVATISATYQGVTITANLTINPLVLSSLTLNPNSIGGGAGSTGEVTLNGAAPPGGVLVSLSSNNAAAAVPASVTIPAGITHAGFTVTTSVVATTTNVTITATSNGATQTASLTLAPITVSALSLYPATIGANGTASAMVTLNGPAPTGGAVVNLQSANTSVATVPASVTVSQGGTRALFSVAAQNVTALSTSVITASYGASSAAATLTVAPADLSALTVSPTAVHGGGTSTGTVTLTVPAGNPVTVTLLSLNSSLVTVPASVTVNTFQTTATFPITTQTVASPTAVTVQASLGAVTKSAVITLTFVPPTGELTEMNASSWAAFASDSATASVADETSLVKVGAGSIRLTSQSAADSGVRYPATGTLNWDLGQKGFLTFWAYAQTGTFNTAQPVIVLKSPNGSLTIAPPAPLMTVGSWRLYQIPLVGFGQWARTTAGTFEMGNVTQFEIHHRASAGGFSVIYDGLQFVDNLPGDLTEGNADRWSYYAAANATTKVKVGTTSLLFVNVTQYRDLTVNSLDLTGFEALNLWIYPTVPGKSFAVTLTARDNSTATYTLGPLLAADTWQLLQVPLLGGGDFTKSGNVNLTEVNGLTFNLLSYGCGGACPDAAAYVDGVTFGAAMPSLTVSPSFVALGDTITGTVRLANPAPPSGTVVSLSSSVPDAIVIPASVAVAPGATTATFTGPVSNSVDVVATIDGKPWTANVGVSWRPAPTTLTVTPDAIVAGSSGTGHLTLAAPAPAGGTVVYLWATAATVPSAVTVPEGTVSFDFPVVTAAGISTQPGYVTAAMNADMLLDDHRLRTAFVVVPSADANLLSVTLAKNVVPAGGSTTGTVTLTRNAPPAGAVVSLSSADPGTVTVSSSVTVPAGSTTASFPLTASPTASSASSTLITASLNGIQLTQSLNILGLATPPVSGECVAGDACSVSVRLNGPVPTGTVDVTLTSSNPAVASVPTTVSIPAGSASATVPVTVPASIASSTPVTVTATALGGSGTAILYVRPSDFDITFSPFTTDTNPPGFPEGFYFGTGLNVLVPHPPASSVTANLTASGPIDGFGSIVILFGWLPKTSVDLKDGPTTLGPHTLYVSQPTAASASITAGSVTRTATTYVLPPVLNSAVLNPPTLSRGGTGDVTFTFCGSGSVASMATTTSDPTIATVSAVDVATEQQGDIPPNGCPPHTISAHVTVGSAAPDGATVDVSGTSWIRTRTARLTVGPLAIQSLSIVGVTPNFPDTYVIPTSVVLLVKLNGTAPTGGAVVALTSTNPSAVPVPPSVTVAAGQSTATVPVTVGGVPGGVASFVTASYNGKRAISVVVGCTLDSLTVGAPGTTYVGGTSVPASVSLTTPAPHTGLGVGLTSSNPALASVPATGVTVPGGATSATFSVTTSAVTVPTTVTITATAGAVVKTATLTIGPAATVTGLAPGIIVPGDTSTVLYGSGFAPGTNAVLAGPVYTLTDFNTPLCNLATPGSCPSVTLTGTPNANGSTLAFAAPATVAPGIYWVTAVTPGGASTTGKWLFIDNASKTFPVVSPDQHQYATRIQPGQTVTGTFSGTNPLGNVTDYNYYYFVGTAGSTVNVSLARVDTSIPWENPASLDPQLEIIAPDGFIYQNLRNEDIRPGVDLNAQITNAVLPATGLYIITAETTRGSGAYSLSFSLGSVAPPANVDRAIPITGNDNTLPLNTPAPNIALMLDPRGYPICGASVAYTNVSEPADRGTVYFSGGPNVSTDAGGAAATTILMTGVGKAQYTPVFQSPDLARPAAAIVSADGSITVPEAERPVTSVPRYRPAGRMKYRVTDITEFGDLALSHGPIVRLKGQQVGRRMERQESGTKGVSGAAKGAMRGTGMNAPAHGTAGSPTDATTGGASAPVGFGPEPVLPLPEVTPQNQPLAGTSCTPTGKFRQAGVSATVNPPFTATLTDITPGNANGIVDQIQGIHGHRIEKELRLQIDIKDATGLAPTYPVLVKLVVDGPHRGTLILDPDGANRRECTEATFLWHDRDAQGNLIPNEMNEIVGYRLGTLSTYVGVTPDPQNPGQVKPVWETAESLTLLVATVDNTQGTTTIQLQMDYGVHPEPGKPDRLVSYQSNGVPEDDNFEYWSDFLTYALGNTTQAGPHKIQNVYYLVDRYENETYGYTNTSATSPPNVTVGFLDQTASGPDFSSYLLAVTWNDGGDPKNMPQGTLPATLTVSYPLDPDWAGGSVSKQINLVFQRGNFHTVIKYPSYEQRFGVDDCDFPITLPPDTDGTAIPPTEAGDQPRFVALLLTGHQVPANLGEPFMDPHNVWVDDPDVGWKVANVITPVDPHLETTDKAAFTISLVDGNGAVATDGSFKIYPCPRFDHEDAPDRPQWGCPGANPQAGDLSPVASQGGVVSNFQANASANGRGYIGIELTHTPKRPGTYFLYFQSLAGNYRIAQQSQLYFDYQPTGIYKGAFAAVNVSGAEFLDENFQRITSELVINQPKTIYVRQTDGGTADTFTLDLSTEEATGTPIDSLPGVVMTRLGRSPAFLSEPVTIIPAGSPVLPDRKCIKGPRLPRAKAIARRAGKEVARCLIGPAVVVELFVDTTLNGRSFRADGSARNPVGGKQANLLLADGTDTTQVSAWVHLYSPSAKKDTPPVPGVTVQAHVTALVAGSFVSNGTTTATAQGTSDSDGWVQFTFQAPGALGDTTVRRAQIVLSAADDPAATQLASAFVYSYGGYDFRNLPMSLADFQQDGFSVSQIRAVFERNFSGTRSFLADFYFKGASGFWDQTGRCRGQASCAWNNTDPVYRGPDCLDPTIPCTLDDTTVQSIPAAERFFALAHDATVSAFWLLVRIQGEEGLLSKPSLPAKLVLDNATGAPQSDLTAQLKAALSIAATRRIEGVLGFLNSGEKEAVPTDGGTFFFTANAYLGGQLVVPAVPIEGFPWTYNTSSYTRVIGQGSILSGGGCWMPPKESEYLIPHYNVAFWCPNRGNYIVWRYNAWVQICTAGGGQKDLAALIRSIRSFGGQ